MMGKFWRSSEDTYGLGVVVVDALEVDPDESKLAKMSQMRKMSVNFATVSTETENGNRHGSGNVNGSGNGYSIFNSVLFHKFLSFTTFIMNNENGS